MDMTISEKDKGLLMILGGILIFAGVYYYGYQNLTAMTQEKQEQNIVLTQQTGLLQQIDKKRQQYESDIQKFVTDSHQLVSRYPAQVREEDEIMYADSLTETIPHTYVSYAATPQGEAIPLTVPARENMLASVQDVTGAIIRNGYQPDGTIQDVSGYLLYVSKADLSFQTTYDGMKKLLGDITASEDVKGIDNIVLTYDDTTGFLTGTLSVNFYSMQGTGAVYAEPAIKPVKRGTANIFGTAAAIDRVQKENTAANQTGTEKTDAAAKD